MRGWGESGEENSSASIQIYPGLILCCRFLCNPRVLGVNLYRSPILHKRDEHSHLLRPPEDLVQLGAFHLLSQFADEKTDGTFVLSHKEYNHPEGKRVLIKEERVRGGVTRAGQRMVCMDGFAGRRGGLRRPGGRRVV